MTRVKVEDFLFQPFDSIFKNGRLLLPSIFLSYRRKLQMMALLEENQVESLTGLSGSPDRNDLEIKKSPPCVSLILKSFFTTIAFSFFADSNAVRKSTNHSDRTIFNMLWLAWPARCARKGNGLTAKLYNFKVFIDQNPRRTVMILNDAICLPLKRPTQEFTGRGPLTNSVQL